MKIATFALLTAAAVAQDSERPERQYRRNHLRRCHPSAREEGDGLDQYQFQSARGRSAAQ